MDASRYYENRCCALIDNDVQGNESTISELAMKLKYAYFHLHLVGSSSYISEDNRWFRPCFCFISILDYNISWYLK